MPSPNGYRQRCVIAERTDFLTTFVRLLQEEWGERWSREDVLIHAGSALVSPYLQTYRGQDHLLGMKSGTYYPLDQIVLLKKRGGRVEAELVADAVTGRIREDTSKFGEEKLLVPSNSKDARPFMNAIMKWADISVMDRKRLTEDLLTFSPMPKKRKQLNPTGGYEMATKKRRRNPYSKAKLSKMSKAQLGEEIKRMRPKVKLSAKKYSTIAKRVAEIQKLYKAGYSAKAFEGVRLYKGKKTASKGRSAAKKRTTRRGEYPAGTSRKKIKLDYRAEYGWDWYEDFDVKCRYKMRLRP